MALDILEAELTWVDGAFRPGVRVAVDALGKIAGVGALPQPPTRRMPGRALLPGFVSAHSHAFQRGLRGMGEVYPDGAGDFWSWREAMYRLVESVSPAQFRAICRLCFDEMLDAGYTTVGEFHYLHHDDPAARDHAMDEWIIEAAAEAGIRMALLMSYYRTGGVGRPLAAGQRRFDTPDVAAFLRQVESVARRLDPRLHTLGLAPHSLRAVPADDMHVLVREAAARGWVCHVHVEEQRKEIEEVQAALGAPPMQWLVDHVPLGPGFTAIHATHATGSRLREYLAAGANVCVCPITEGNLGDGISDLTAMLGQGACVCIGTDSNIRLDPAEELRWVEFVQRLRCEKRGIARDAGGALAARLLEIGTIHGARALGLPTGEIAAGRFADFVTLDLRHRSLAGWTMETLPAAYIFGAGREAIGEVCVGGRWRGMSNCE